VAVVLSQKPSSSPAGGTEEATEEAAPGAQGEGGVRSQACGPQLGVDGLGGGRDQDTRTSPAVRRVLRRSVPRESEASATPDRAVLPLEQILGSAVSDGFVEAYNSTPDGAAHKPVIDAVLVVRATEVHRTQRWILEYLTLPEGTTGDVLYSSRTPQRREGATDFDLNVEVRRVGREACGTAGAILFVLSEHESRSDRTSEHTWRSRYWANQRRELRALRKSVGEGVPVLIAVPSSVLLATCVVEHTHGTKLLEPREVVGRELGLSGRSAPSWAVMLIRGDGSDKEVLAQGLEWVAPHMRLGYHLKRSVKALVLQHARTCLGRCLGPDGSVQAQSSYGEARDVLNEALEKLNCVCARPGLTFKSTDSSQVDSDGATLQQELVDGVLPGLQATLQRVGGVDESTKSPSEVSLTPDTLFQVR
jgi:hypothetical protein